MVYFNIDDFVKLNDPTHEHDGYTGRVIGSPSRGLTEVMLIDGSTDIWRSTRCFFLNPQPQAGGNMSNAQQTATQAAAKKGTFRNPFESGDVVQVADKHNPYYNQTGTVVNTNHPFTAEMKVLFNDGSTHILKQGDCVPAGAVISAAPVPARRLYEPGDIVEHLVFNCKGEVLQYEQPGDPYLSVETDDPHHLKGGKMTVQWKPSNVTLISAASSMSGAGLPVAAQQPVSGSQHTDLDAGDYVKYIGSDPAYKGLRGTVMFIQRVVHMTGSHLEAVVQVSAGQNESIPVDSLVACAPIGGHYQALAQEESNFEPGKKPFDHDQLGTDLSGDELMKTIREFCEGNQK